MAPIFLVVAVVVAAAFGVAVMNNKNKKDAAEVQAGESSGGETRPNPFADVDTSPPDRPGVARQIAPAGLESAPEYVGAKKLADEAFELAKVAAAAKASGDMELYREKGHLVRVKLEQAMEETADWEIGIQSEYTDEDVQVRKIGREIDRWRKMLNKYRMVK